MHFQDVTDSTPCLATKHCSGNASHRRNVSAECPCRWEHSRAPRSGFTRETRAASASISLLHSQPALSRVGRDAKRAMQVMHGNNIARPLVCRAERAPHAVAIMWSTLECHTALSGPGKCARNCSIINKHHLLNVTVVMPVSITQIMFLSSMLLIHELHMICRCLAGRI